MMTEELGELARCTYLRNDLLNRKPFPLLKHIFMIKQACNQLTAEKLPTCFYHIIKTLREYPDAPELESVTKEMLKTSRVPGNFKFRNTPPALAYLFLDAMRSAYGKLYCETASGGTGSGFVMMPARTRVTKHCSLKIATKPQMNTSSRIGNGWQHAGSRRMALRVATRDRRQTPPVLVCTHVPY